MKFTNPLLLTLPLLPTITAFAITPPLSKRRFEIGEWVSQRARFRTLQMGGLRLPEECPRGFSDHKTTSLSWPEGIPGRPYVDPITDDRQWINVCKGERKCDGKKYIWVNTDCPATEEALLNRIISEGVYWDPAITLDQAKEALHRLDPATWPESPLPGTEPRLEDKISGMISGIGAITAGANLVQTVQNLTPVNAPAATQQGVRAGCKKWHVVVGGDSCWAVVNRYGIDLTTFYEWNRAVNDGGECSQLWVGYAYCVGI